VPKLSKYGVQIALGLLWLLDGVLQLQHQMFTSAFATQVIEPAIQGQPRFVIGPMQFGVHLFLMHPAVFNSLFALTQIGIAALILRNRTRKRGLLLSLPWSLVVWVFGEGYGGIFTGHTLLLMGAPGAVILYAILALAVMPSKQQRKKTKQKPQVAFWLALVWLVLWVGGAAYQLLPGQNSTDDISSMIVGNIQGAPNWLASADAHTANVIKGLGKTHKPSPIPSQIDTAMNMTGTQMMHMTSEPYIPGQGVPGYWFALLLAVFQVCIGFGVLFPGVWRKSAVAGGALLSVIFWVVGQSLGGYFTGLSTDPNSGPLFVLLGLAILGCTDMDRQLLKLSRKFEDRLVGKPDNGSGVELVEL
jgi:hypothetical protein